MDCSEFIIIIIVFMIFASKFEITPIKPKICDLKIIDKNFNLNINSNTYIDLEENIFNKIIKLNNLNSSYSEINYFNKFYKINLYENNSHIIAHICEEIEDKNLFKNN